MRWRLPSRPRCSLVVLVAAAGHDGRRPAISSPTAKLLIAAVRWRYRSELSQAIPLSGLTPIALRTYGCAGAPVVLVDAKGTSMSSRRRAELASCEGAIDQ